MKKIIFKSILFILISIIAVFLIIVLLGYLDYRKAIKVISIEDKIKTIQSDENYIKSEDMSEEFKAAIVAVEDHRFYNHSGIDFWATGHAMYVNIFSGSFDYGASGISQQVGRLLYFTQEKSVIRKFSELFVAFNLEKNYSKNEILELYVNLAYYGKGYYGIGEASIGFFGKVPGELTKEEAAYLAGLPNAPSIYSVNGELGEERKQQVLNAMEKYADEIYEK